MMSPAEPWKWITGPIPAGHLYLAYVAMPTIGALRVLLPMEP